VNLNVKALSDINDSSSLVGGTFRLVMNWDDPDLFFASSPDWATINYPEVSMANVDNLRHFEDKRSIVQTPRSHMHAHPLSYIHSLIPSLTNTPTPSLTHTLTHTQTHTYPSHPLSPIPFTPPLTHTLHTLSHTYPSHPLSHIHIGQLFRRQVATVPSSSRWCR
jgi:hypothetical protein